MHKTAEFYCSICETHVIVGSKHCRICNRCCADFDHHCRWVSNDIGIFNYIEFMRLLLFTLATLIIGSILSLYAIIQIEANTPDFESSSHMLLGKTDLLVINWVTLVLNVLTISFLVYLTTFHSMLIRRGITTMKWI